MVSVIWTKIKKQVFPFVLFQGKVKDIIFRETEDEIRKCALSNGKVPVVSWGSFHVSWKEFRIDKYVYFTKEYKIS